MSMKLVKKIISLCKLIFYAHHNQFDMIRPQNQPHHSNQIRKCYTFSLVLYIVTVLYGTLGLECVSRPVCHIVLAALSSSPYNFYHQMFPLSVSHQINMGATAMILCSISCWVALLVTPPIDPRFLICPQTEGDKNGELEPMCAFQRKLLKLLYGLEVTMFVASIAFLYGHVLYINAAYEHNLWSIIFWALLNPLHLYHNMIFTLSMPIYVVLASKYITIQQKALVNKMTEINLKLDKIGRNRKWICLNRVLHHRIWLKYMTVSGQTCSLCKRLREWARFWSPMLSIILTSIVSIQCYLFYVCLFSTQLPLILRSTLILLVFNAILNDFMLISACAAVVNNFKAIMGENRKFYQRFQSRPGVRPVLSHNLAKAESLQDRRLLHSYAFRLFGHYRITNKSFYIAISYISTFFLFIAKS